MNLVGCCGKFILPRENHKLAYILLTSISRYSDLDMQNSIFHQQASSALQFHRHINTLWPIQNGRHIADDVFRCILLNQNILISFRISLKFVPNGPISNSPETVEIMTWRRSGAKPLSEPMMLGLPTHICVTRPEWVHSRYLQQTADTSLTTRLALFGLMA